MKPVTREDVVAMEKELARMGELRTRALAELSNVSRRKTERYLELRDGLIEQGVLVPRNTPRK